MGKIFDFIMSDSWEEFQRIQLYKKLGEIPEKLKEINSGEKEDG